MGSSKGGVVAKEIYGGGSGAGGTKSTSKKKRKLVLKDRIAAIEDVLLPDIIA